MDPKRFKNKLIIHKFLCETEAYHSEAQRKLGFRFRANNLCSLQCLVKTEGLEKLKMLKKILIV